MSQLPAPLRATRSTVTIPTNIFDGLDQSPLKQAQAKARSARHARSSSVEADPASASTSQRAALDTKSGETRANQIGPPRPVTPPRSGPTPGVRGDGGGNGDGSDDELLLSPSHRTPRALPVLACKRSSAEPHPDENAGAPEPKRPRRDVHIDFAALANKPFPSRGPSRSPRKAASLSPSRARSVPPASSPRAAGEGEARHLDLRAVPPSPWRSSPTKTRVASVPPPSALHGLSESEEEDEPRALRNAEDAVVRTPRNHHSPSRRTPYRRTRSPTPQRLPALRLPSPDPEVGSSDLQRTPRPPLVHASESIVSTASAVSTTSVMDPPLTDVTDRSSPSEAELRPDRHFTTPFRLGPSELVPRSSPLSPLTPLPETPAPAIVLRRSQRAMRGRGSGSTVSPVLSAGSTSSADSNGADNGKRKRSAKARRPLVLMADDADADADASSSSAPDQRSSSPIPAPAGAFDFPPAPTPIVDDQMDVDTPTPPLASPDFMPVANTPSTTATPVAGRSRPITPAPLKTVGLPPGRDPRARTPTELTPRARSTAAASAAHVASLFDALLSQAATNAEVGPDVNSNATPEVAHITPLPVPAPPPAMTTATANVVVASRPAMQVAGGSATAGAAKAKATASGGMAKPKAKVGPSDAAAKLVGKLAPKTATSKPVATKPAPKAVVAAKTNASKLSASGSGADASKPRGLVQAKLSFAAPAAAGPPRMTRSASFRMNAAPSASAASMELPKREPMPASVPATVDKGKSKESMVEPAAFQSALPARIGLASDDEPLTDLDEDMADPIPPVEYAVPLSDHPSTPPRGRKSFAFAASTSSSRAKSQPSSPVARGRSRPSSPPGRSKSRPSSPTGRSKSRPSSPVGRNKSRPSSPLGRSKSRPSSPTRSAAGPSEDARIPRGSLASGAEKSGLKRRSASVAAPRSVASFFNPTKVPTPEPEPVIKPGESLAGLSRALEKLAQPAPARPGAPRPSTSLGFNERPGMKDSASEVDEADSEPEEQLSARSKARAREEASYRPSSSARPNGLKRPATTPNGPPPLKRRLSVGASGSSVIPVRTPAVAGPSSAGTFKTPTLPASATKPLSSIGANKVSAAINGAARTPFGQPSRVGGPSMIKRPFGAGPGWGTTGIMGARNTVRASRPTTLAMVEASPVKGAADPDVALDSADGMDDRLEAPAFNGTNDDVEMSDAGSAREEEPSSDARPGGWSKKASMRASLAMQGLNESLAEVPHTPPSAAELPMRQTRSRATGSMGPPTAPVSTSGSPAGDGSTTAGPSRVSRSGRGKRAEQTLGVLGDCTVFLDVRTDDGDDASEMFAQMLLAMGARLVQRFGPSCTHIVFKNGLMSTITKWKLQNEPRAFVVGIAWVVECVEQRTRLDEEKFKVSLEGMNVAGTNKRRRSMLPKSVEGVPLDPGMSSDDGDVSMDGDTPAQTTSAGMEDGLTPLERARRRRSLLPVPK